MTARVQPLRKPHWCDAQDMAQLASIHQPEVTIVTLQRSVEPAIASATSALLALPELRDIALVGIPGPDFRARLAHLLPSVPARDALIADLDLLAAAFCLLLRPRAVGLRLQQGCPGPVTRFAALDEVGILVSSYGATGREWLPNGTVHRHRLDASAAAPSFDETRVVRLPPFAIGVLKGEGWPGNAGNGIMNRTPVSLPAQRGLHLTIVPF
jgi:hypothetical protein